MDWKDLANIVGKAAPALGTLLGGPGGAAVGGLIASALGTANAPEDVAAAVKDPDALVKLRQIEADKATKLQELLAAQAQAEIAAAQAQVQAVNNTMQTEAKADHWPTYSWRPAIGFVFAAYIASLFILPLFGKAPVVLSADMTMAVGAILGVASWFRGKAQADPRIPTDSRG